MAGSQAVPPLVEALSGSVGASLANVLVYPLDLVTARIQTKTPQSSKTSTISNGKQPNVDGKPSSSSATSSARSKDAYADLPTALTTIYHASGGSIAGFYQGIASDTLSTALSNFLYFYIFAAAHNLWNRYKTHRAQVQHHGGGKGAKTVAGLAAVENLVVGALAGILSRGVTTPLSTITVRKQTSAKSKTRHDEDLERKAEAAEDESEEESDYNQDSSMSIARDIYQEHGLAGFWRGYSSACALTINPAITFYLIEAFKRTLLPRRFRAKPTQTQTFFISAFASAIATSICYPLILAKTRLQWKSPSGKMMYRNMNEVFVKTVRKAGIAGLYVGLQTQIIKGFIAQGVTMAVKQRIELLVVYMYRRMWLARRQLAH